MEFFRLNGNRRLCEKCLCAMNIMFESIFKLLLMKHHHLNKELQGMQLTDAQCISSCLAYQDPRALECETSIQKEHFQKEKGGGKEPEMQLEVMWDLVP